MQQLFSEEVCPLNLSIVCEVSAHTQASQCIRGNWFVYNSNNHNSATVRQEDAAVEKEMLHLTFK